MGPAPKATPRRGYRRRDRTNRPVYTAARLQTDNTRTTDRKQQTQTVAGGSFRAAFSWGSTTARNSQETANMGAWPICKR
jgi:hypothetical protein